MKVSLIILVFISNFLLAPVFAQVKKETYITQKDIVGVWQRDSKLVRNGLSQNFEFYMNGKFVVNLGSDKDDGRNVIKLKGRYRLDKDKLYITILSKTIVDGKIVISDAGVSLNIFSYEGKEVEILEKNPVEISDPCYITVITTQNIKISNEIYFKIK